MTDSLYEFRRGGFRAAKGFKKSQGDKFLERSELAALLDAARKEQTVYGANGYDLFSLAGNFGLRCSEAIDLSFKNFEPLSFGYFTVHTLKKKADQEDRIYVGKEGQSLCSQVIARRRKMVRGDKLFTFTSRSARYLFAHFAAIAKLSPNVSFHSLRHTAARMMHDAASMIPEYAPKAMNIVGAFLRHNPTTTMIYTYPSPQELTRTIEKRGIVW